MKRRTFTTLLGSVVAAASTEVLAAQHEELPDTMPKKMILPAALKPGDLIQLVTPASPASEEKIQKAISNLEGQGFKVKYSDAIRNRFGHLAGTDAQRLEDFHSAFEDKAVKAVWCVRGGYGCTRILPHINYPLIKANPKILIGYSDVTALLNAIHQRTGLVGFHGPVGATPFTTYNVDNFNAVLMQPSKGHQINLSPFYKEKEDTAYQPYVITAGRVTAPLVGGNLCLLATMAGTPFQVDFKDKLVFIEDVGEKPYRIDRMLTQLFQSSNLHLAKGIILGIFEDCLPKNEEFSLSLADTLKLCFEKTSMPIVYGFTFGHIQNMCTFPLGVTATLDTTTFSVTIEQDAVSN